LSGGEQRSHPLAVQDQDGAEQEQSADSLFDLHPHREGAGQRDDDRDGHHLNGRNDSQPIDARDRAQAVAYAYQHGSCPEPARACPRLEHYVRGNRRRSSPLVF
jgi:hypothetical protein